MYKFNLKNRFKKIDSYWDPKIIGQVNQMYVKIAKIKGEFEFHTHKENDELFYIVKGTVKMHYRDDHEFLDQGDMTIVPKGVEHKPSAEDEAYIMMFESKNTINTGDKKSELTKENLDWI